MKKLVFCLMATCLSLTFFPVLTIAQTKEAIEPTTMVIAKPTESVESTSKQSELNEPTAQNQTKVQTSKKNKLNKFNSNSNNQRQGGVYISVGGALLIILILILIL